METKKPYSNILAKVILVAMALVVSACSTHPEDAFVHKRLGIRFEFPQGWSRLSKAERRAKSMSRETILAISNSTRQANVILVDVRLPPAAVRDIDSISSLMRLFAQDGDDSSLSDEERDFAARLATLHNSMAMALPERYRDFQLLRKEFIAFSGIPAGEIVFIGRRGDEGLRWRRLLLLTSLTRKDQLLLLGFGAPLAEKEKYSSDFQYIEDSWEWN